MMKLKMLLSKGGGPSASPWMRSLYPALDASRTKCEGRASVQRGSAFQRRSRCGGDCRRSSTTATTIRASRAHAGSGNPVAPIRRDRGRGFDESGSLRFETLHEMNANAVRAYGDDPLFGTYVREEQQSLPSQSGGGGGGEFEWMTYSEFGTKVERCRRVLKDIGVTPHSKVGIISNNRWEWAAIAAASYSLSAVLCPMYEAQRPDDWTHILNDSGCVALFCASEDIFAKVTGEVLPSAPSVRATLCLDAPVSEPNSFGAAMRRAEDEAEAEADEGGGRSNRSVQSVVAPTPDDLANLIYTSGTTGKPKGVELLHTNQVSNIHAGRSMMTTVNANDPFDTSIRRSDRSLAFLPWAHSYGQTCELWCLLAAGASVGICRGVPNILDDLAQVKPTLLFAVPTLYKRVHDGVLATMQDASPLRRALLKSALRLGRAHAQQRDGGRDGAPSMGFVDGFKHRLLDEIVLSKIRARFGGNLRAGFVAGAACPKEIVEFMDAVGIPICEGYGLTETSPVIAMNVLSARKAGSVGMPLKGVDVCIIDSNGIKLGPGKEGEICCSGPNVMRGYHNKPEETNSVISLAPDGKTKLFHTGDLGKIDSEGFLSVTGRLKEIYKLENGKYVSPAPIEQTVAMSRFVSQVVVCGANRPHNVALVVPDWAAIRSELKLSDDMPEDELARSERVRGLISEEIKVHCYKIKKFEVPKDHALVAPFTAANNMLTPKMSIRRHIVIDTYAGAIANLYGETAGREHCGQDTTCKMKGEIA